MINKLNIIKIMIFIIYLTNILNVNVSVSTHFKTELRLFFRKNYENTSISRQT